MREPSLRALTWGTLIGATLSAVWLAVLSPVRPFGASAAEPAIEVDVTALQVDVPRAGQAASSPEAMASAHPVTERQIQ